MRYIAEKEAEDFLEKEGFRVVKRSFCSSKKELKKCLEEVGTPFIMKVSGKNIIHKTEIGGVRVGIKNYTNLVKEFEKLKKIKGSEGVLLQQKLGGPGVKEFLVGIKKTPEFGHTIVFGKGGVQVEEKKDLSFRIAPLEKEEIKKMIKDTKVSKILLKQDMRAIEEVLFRISNLIEKYPGISELDVNPLIVHGGVATIADARFVLE